MDIMASASELLNYLYTEISPLPWTVKGVGLGLMALLVLSAVGKFLTFRWIKAATNLILALIIALVMARYGTDIAAMLQPKTDQTSLYLPIV